MQETERPTKCGSFLVFGQPEVVKIFIQIRKEHYEIY
jgi:hypothetical protein